MCVCVCVCVYATCLLSFSIYGCLRLCVMKYANVMNSWHDQIMTSPTILNTVVSTQLICATCMTQ